MGLFVPHSKRGETIYSQCTYRTLNMLNKTYLRIGLFLYVNQLNMKTMILYTGKSHKL